MTDISMGASPRGFAVPAPDNQRPNRFSTKTLWIGTFDAGVGDPVIDNIWKQYRQRLSPMPSPVLVTSLVSRLAYLFGEFEDWVWANLAKNGWLNEYSVDFIRDTIVYVNGGNRKYPMTTWYDLVDINLEYQRGFGDSRLYVLEGLTLPSTEELLSNWVSRDDGISDLFMTAHLLFGSK